MKKNWLSGLLLGVSLALLLSGGVALAQDLYLRADKDCVECWPGRGIPTEDRYLLPYTMGEWDTNYELCIRTTIDGEIVPPSFCGYYYPPTDPYSDTEWFPCELTHNDLAPVLGLGGEASVADMLPDLLGQWKYRIWQRIPGSANPSAEISFLVADVCEVQFVPEAGSILLLGSGLAGLAGYAALRLRSGQALRWRSRE